jgi:hypothetical protein
MITPHAHPFASLYMKGPEKKRSAEPRLLVEPPPRGAEEQHKADAPFGARSKCCFFWNTRAFRPRLAVSTKQLSTHASLRVFAAAGISAADEVRYGLRVREWTAGTVRAVENQLIRPRTASPALLRLRPKEEPIAPALSGERQKPRSLRAGRSGPDPASRFSRRRNTVAQTRRTLE